ncbi:FecR domain-containing protein [Tenacibaculum dicentrarchi]|nr:FecR domain-containing protein [Tenacibaculum dicentrarchi]MCD8420338.1 FecR domain-containing protein [Tenacibaculum dicentrarchi]MCD8437669.1 FecR domain-containing protein [Tenacibaculum dicentrarchi]MCD8451743.1 FecR domain-containing protein [Tenacibaculum dicentrarchi]MCG8828441.1 FecR family protein [Tenacibaculum dicentrarchi]
MKRDKIKETDLWAYISNTASVAIKVKVERWKNSTEYDEQLFEEIKKINQITKENISVATPNIEINKTAFFKKIESIKKKNNFKKLFFKYAAAAIIILSTSFFAYLITQPQKIYIATTYGEQKEVTLSDGSVVWLNASSKISYKENSPRTIRLEGEAFFEVAKDKKHPFTVETPDNIIVKALGTSFNIKSYKENNYYETVLFTGKVAVNAKDSEKNRIIMLPNDKIRILKKNKHVLKSVIKNKMNTISWREGKIQFKNKTFKEIVTDFKNQYNLKFHFENEKISNVKFTGTFEKTMPIREILEILKITKPFEYRFNAQKNTWIIK